jgi:hypothetical protein
MEVGGGSKGARAKPSAAAAAPIEDVSSSELSVSTASAHSLDDVHTTDVEVVRQRREKKATKVAQREERKKERKKEKERRGTQA